MSRDYQVRVHILEGRDLKGRESAGISDPICFVEVGGQKQHTAIMKKTLSCTWDHLFFFELKCPAEEFRRTKILVNVYDANTFKRNVLIGGYEFECGWVNDQAGHEIFRKWVALSDVTDKFEGIQGFLKLSAVALGPGESSPSHDDDEEEDEEEGTDLQSLVLMPPNITTEEYHLLVRCYRAENLPKMDQFGKTDGFCRVKFGGTTNKTKIVKKTLSPVWDQELQIPVTIPCMSDTIPFEVLDWDQAGKDEIIATVPFSLRDVMAMPMPPRWVNLYGALETGHSKIEQQLNTGSLEGNAFRGRVLMSMMTQRVEQAKLAVNAIGGAQAPQTESYTLRFDLYEATEIPTGRNAEVEVCVGSNKVVSSSAGVKNKCASWFESLKDLKVSLPQETKDLPDIIISLYVKTISRTRVGYLRLKAQDVLQFNGPPRWYLFKADPLGEKLGEEDLPGFVLFKLGFGRTYDVPLTARPQVQRPKAKPFELRAHIYQARGLPAADETGTSDPYLVVRLGPKRVKTKVKAETCYPMWYETLKMNVELPDPISLAPDIQCLVFDHDTVTADDVLGRFTVPVGDLSKDFQDTPTWHPLFIEGGPPEGEVLASFQLIPAEQASSVEDVAITPQFKECTLEISMIGLRNLLPFRMLPIQAAYAEFDCGERKDRTKIIRTKHCNHPSGADPNHLECLKLPVSLPLDPLFCPTVNVKVFDYRLGGALTPLIGSTSIPIAPFLPWTKKHEETEEASHRISFAAGTSPPSDDGAGVVSIQASPDDDTKSESDRPLLKEEEKPKKKAKGASKGLGIELRKIARVVPGVSEETSLGGEDDDEDSKKGVDERPKLKTGLEAQLLKVPFAQYDLQRGRKRGVSGFMKKDGEGSLRMCGKFKGNFKVLENATLPPHYASPNLKDLYRPRNLVVRAYILRGLQLVPKDENGSSDPYIVLKVGSGKNQRVIKDREDVKKETLNPEFFKHFDVECELPGQSKFTVELWDWDLASGDDLIGRTEIDIENRYFSNEWKDIKMKPIEQRDLWNPASSNPQGKIELWLEIMTAAEARTTVPVNISPPAPEKFELRAVVWQTKEVVFKDAKMSDIFVTGKVEETGEKHETDTHWRSENGKGSFNWRFVFPITLPMKVPRIKFAVWDKDILKANDSIAEANLNLKGFFKRAYKQKRSQLLKKQWITLTHPNFEGPQGKMQVEIEVLPENEARIKTAGQGRDEPNQNPFLPERDRPATSFAFWRLDKLIWHKYKKYTPILVCICLIACLAVLFPVIFPLLGFF